MLFSIITPVYNSDKYLEECINSVLNQTVGCWELLLVDDGSTDRSGTICDDFAKKDSRIRVFHQDNRGEGAARNTALKHAKGDYVLMLDSDDWYENNCVMECRQQLGEHEQIDVLQFNYKYVNLQNNHTEYIFRGREDMLCQSKQEYQQLHLPILCAAGWCFRKEIIDKYDIQFDATMRFHTDRVFSYTFLQYARKVKVTNVFLYNYRANPESVNHTTSHENIIKSTITFAQYRKAIHFFHDDIAEQALNYAVNLTVNNVLADDESATLFSGMGIQPTETRNRGYRCFLRLFNANNMMAIKLLHLYHKLAMKR